MNELSDSEQERNRKEKWLQAILESAAQISQLGRAVRSNAGLPLGLPLGVAGLYEEFDKRTVQDLREPQRQRVEAFRRAVASLLTRVNNYLDLAHIDTGHFQMEKADFDLKLVLEQTLEKMCVPAQAKDLILKLVLLQGMPKILSGDPGRLQQILANLLDNAIEDADDGEIRLTAGADASNIYRVHFGVLFRATGLLDDKSEGIRLCRALLRQMGAELNLRSAPGADSEFFFDVQFAPAETARTTAPNPPDAAKILIAEDSEDSRFLLQEFLKRGPYQVTFAENGKVALEAALAQPFDLILMDIQMPVMDGLTATRLIREVEQREGRVPVPLLALTAHTRKADIELSLAAGCNAHISKPVSKSGLLDTIQKYLSMRTDNSLLELNRSVCEAVETSTVVRN
jgi:CheY-like chemotaxis protein